MPSVVYRNGGRMARRGHGEGTIYQRANDGRWCAQFSLAGGKRNSFMGKTRADVARRLAEALRDRDKGLPIVGERMTVGRYLAEWLEVGANTSTSLPARLRHRSSACTSRPHSGVSSLVAYSAPGDSALRAAARRGALGEYGRRRSIRRYARRFATRHEGLVQRNVLERWTHRATGGRDPPLDVEQVTALLARAGGR